MDKTPQFQHDCKHCTFLGREVDLRNGGKLIDMYICQSSSAILGGSLLARFSDEGADYHSVAVDVLESVRDFPKDSALWKVYAFAKAAKRI